MKKLFFTMILTSVALTAFVQNHEQEKLMRIKFLLAAGPTFSTIGGGDSWDGLLPGAYAGAGIIIDPGKEQHNMFLGEINYSMMGSKYSEPDYNLNGKVLLSYINVPLMYQHHSDKGILLEAGLQPGFLLSAKDKYNGNNDDYKGNTKSFHFGIPVGVGYYFLNTFGINLRYTHGLSNINKQSDGKDYNRCFTLRLFWIFDKTKK